MIKASIINKITIIIVLSIVLSCIVTTLISSYSLSQALGEESKKLGIIAAQDLAVMSVEPIFEKNLFVLDKLVLDTANKEGFAYVFILDANNRVIAHSFEKEYPPGLVEINKISSGGQCTVLQVDTPGGLVYDIACPIEYYNSFAGTARVGLSQTYMQQVVKNNLINNLVATVLLVMLVNLIAFNLFTKTVSPIKQLHEVSEQLEKGNMNARSEIKTGDEIGQLSQAFNRMASEIQKRERELKEYNEHLEDTVNERTSELNEAMEKLKELDRMKDEFFSSATHDIQNPLTPVRGQSELLMRGHFGELNEKQRKSIETILKNTNRLIRLTEDIMTMSRMRAGVLKFEMVENNIGDIIENSANNIDLSTKEKKITVIKKYPESLAVKCDKDRINQVMNNLLVNAVKFTPENGKITIEAGKAGNEIIISVSDTGIGILNENQEKVFNPFFQVSSKYGGTGLGLTICKNIIEAHHGRMWIESEIGKGSRFSFVLPVN